MQVRQVLTIMMLATSTVAKPNPAVQQVIKVPRCKRANWRHDRRYRSSSSLSSKIIWVKLAFLSGIIVNVWSVITFYANTGQCLAGLQKEY